MRSILKSITLSSVVLASGFAQIPANALDVSALLKLFPQASVSGGNTTTPSYNTPNSSSTPSNNSVAAIEQAIHNQVNQYRASRGLPPLSLDARISAQSRIHSQNMANGSVAFSHDGFQGRVQVISREIRYSSAAENVAYNYGTSDPVTTAVQGWINSSGHRQNMEGNFNLTGIGVAQNAQGRYYFTQIFIRAQAQTTQPTTAPTPVTQPPTTQPPAATTPSNNSVTGIEQAIHNQVNQYRASRGLPPLTLDARVSQQSRIHSQNMANGSVPFSHNGFAQRVQVIKSQIPYGGAAENVAYNYGNSDPATTAVRGWINSSGHRQNMEGNYNLTGIGVVKNAQGRYYFTQIFVRSR